VNQPAIDRALVAAKAHAGIGGSHDQELVIKLLRLYAESLPFFMIL